MLLGTGETSAPHLPFNVDGDIGVARDLKRVEERTGVEVPRGRHSVKDTGRDTVRTGE